MIMVGIKVLFDSDFIELVVVAIVFNVQNLKIPKIMMDLIHTF